MFKKGYLLCISILIFSNAFAQKVWTVSANPVIPAQYTSLQAAIDAASTGDIIYLHPAAVTYGGVEGIVLNKAVSIIGGGMYNNYTGRFNRLSSVIGKLFIRGNADNSKIANCFINRVFFENTTSIDTRYQSFILEYNYIGRVDFTPFQGVISAVQMQFRNNVIGNLNFNEWRNFGDDFDLLVQNNIIALVSNGGGKAITFRNNLFNPKSLATISLEKMDGSTFINNIFYGNGQTTSIGIANTSACIFDYNLSFATIDGFNGGDSNSFGANNLPDTDPLFTKIQDDFLNLDYIFRSDFTLLEGSPAIGAGAGNTDIGITGGEWPFYPNQPYSFPIISELKVSNPVVNQDETLRFTIKAENP